MLNTRVLPVAAFVLLSGSAVASAHAEPLVLYGVDSTTDTLERVNPATGFAEAVGPLGFSNVQSLAFDTLRGRLVGVDITSDRLVSIDPVSGAAETIGSVGFGLVLSLAYDASRDRLFGFDGTTDVIVSIDPSTGVGTELGPPAGLAGIEGLTFGDDGTLYALDTSFVDSRLATIDPETGAATTLFTVDSGFVNSLVFDPTSGDLLAANSTTDELLRIDLLSGTTSVVGRIGVDQPAIVGLAFGVIPAPGPALVGVLAMAGMAGRRRDRSRAGRRGWQG